MSDKPTLPPPEPPQPRVMYESDFGPIGGWADVIPYWLMAAVLIVPFAVYASSGQQDKPQRTSSNWIGIETVDGHEFIVSRYQIIHHPDCPKCKEKEK